MNICDICESYDSLRWKITMETTGNYDRTKWAMASIVENVKLPE